MSKKKIALASAVLAAGFASVASAHDRAPTVTLGGTLDTQFGYQNQKHAFNTADDANQRSKFGIVNDTKVHVKVDAHKGGLKYGGMIVLNTDTSTSKQNEDSVAHQTMVYGETSFGRLEAGSYTGAYDALHVGASTMGAATGGINGDWHYWVNTDVDGAPGAGNGRNTLIFKSGLPTGFDRSYSQNASKVTYYTPTFAGFKAGLTYTPDTEQHGTVTNLRGVAKDFATLANYSNQAKAYKNVFQGGLAYHGKFDKVMFKFSALGEAGTAKKVIFGANTVDRKDLRAWELGASAHYMGFGLGGSYGDWGKSGLAKSVTNAGVTTAVAGLKAGKYWTVAANYEHAAYGVSLGYLASETGGFGADLATPAYSTAKGKADVFSFGVDYKVAPGFMPYAEVSHFSLKDKSQGVAGKNTGNVGLAGVKLSF